MSEIEDLLSRYDGYVRRTWDHNLAGAQKVWFARYDPGQERRLRLRIDAFQTATTDAGHKWHRVDMASWFAEWMADHEYRNAYFEQPEDMGMALADFAAAVEDRLRQVLKHEGCRRRYRRCRAWFGIVVRSRQGLGVDREGRWRYSGPSDGFLPGTTGRLQLAAAECPRRLELPRSANLKESSSCLI